MIPIKDKYNIIVSKFEPQSHYHVHFRINKYPWKRYNFL